MASEALGTRGSLRALVISAVAGLVVLAATWHVPQAEARDGRAAFDLSVRPEYREPVTLASKDGVLEVTLTAHQGQASLDTVAKPVAEHARLRLRADPRHGLEWADVGRQFVSRADAAGLSRARR